jgi:hypothetical protein
MSLTWTVRLVQQESWPKLWQNWTKLTPNETRELAEWWL